MFVASSDGRGFLAPQDEMIGNTRKGKGLLTLDAGSRMAVIIPAVGDHVATMGENRKLLVFALDQVPEMARGKGVKIQSFADGGLLDLKTFARADGLSWSDSAGRQQSADDWKDWIGKRAQSGRLAPRGFNKNGKFSGG